METLKRRVRVRFAPSPTGALHIGGVRTALYNYLFARQHGGDFLLRIEDTDSQRLVPGAEKYIMEALAWCGIKIDEGVEQGGPHAPYRQSERREIYLKYALQLIDSGCAYYAFDTPEELNTLRTETEASGGIFSYNFSIREKMNTSLRLSPAEVKERMDSGDQWVIRFKMPESEDVNMVDLIRGKVTINTSTLDDKVLYKSADQLPTYHLANIVDDHLMEISHVIRGEEWLPSLPLHYLLYRSLGWSDTQPEFSHLSLILKPTGKGKLSKRDGDKMGFPVFPLQWNAPDGEVSRGYREDGYLPDAFINMLALLGWNPGTEQEIFSMDELVEQFSLDRVIKSGARFDPEKAKWFNSMYIRAKSNEELGVLFLPILQANGVACNVKVAEKVAGMIKDRAVLIGDLWELSSYMFVAPWTYDPKVVAKQWNADNRMRITDLRKLLSTVSNFTSQSVDRAVHQWIAENEYPMGAVMNTFRLAIVGEGKGPSMFDICEVIGQDETLSRLDKLIATEI